MGAAVSSPWTVRVTGDSATMVADADEVRRGLSVFADPSAGCELMALTSGKHRTLPGNDLNGLCKAVSELPGGAGIYVRLNPVPASLKKPAVNEDVVRRRFVYIDVDPDKPQAFQDESATEEEKARATETARRVRMYLARSGFPKPVVMDSGNGCALFYACEFPNDTPSRDAIKRLLKALAERFKDAGGKIDKSVHNANRLTKVPGTWARKGTHTDGRPHRPCRLVEVPEVLEPVTLDLINAVGGPEPETTAAVVIASTDTANGRKEAYGRAALEGVASDVANAPVGDRNNALYRASARLGELVAGGVVQASDAEETLKAVGAERDPDRGDIAGTVERGMKKGAQEPKGLPESSDPKPVMSATGTKTPAQAATPGANDWTVLVDGEVVAEGPPVEIWGGGKNKDKPATGRQFELHTLRGLMSVQFAEPRWVVPGVLSEGLNILAGKPKMGKSMLALNLAMTIAAGGLAMGNIRTTPGDVLYLSLEDRTRRLQSRARKMLKGIGCPASPRLTLAAQWPRQGEGGLELVEWWMKRVECPALVIIDVWGKFRPPGNPKANAYSQDYEHMTPLKNLSDSYGCCALALMHCRKGKSEDIVEDVSGTLGIAGAADGIIVLDRSRNDNEAKIFITGRDVPDTELALRFDPDNLTWENLGDAGQLADGRLQNDILRWLSGDRRHSFWSTKAIALGIGKEKPSQVRPVLDRMNKDGKIQKRIQGNDAEWCFPGSSRVVDTGEIE